MMKPFPLLMLWCGLCVVTHTLPAQDSSVPENVLIFAQDSASYPPCEPSIAVSPADPSKLVAGAVLDHVATSSDSGKTWQTSRLESSLGVYGDPCIIGDDEGSFYYFHLSNPSGEGWTNPDILDRIVCQRLLAGEAAWDDGWSIGFNEPKDQDKEWAVWDPINERLIVAWTQFDTYNSADPACESNILVSVSEKGKKWSEAVDVSEVPGNCLDDSRTVEGAVPAVYTDGSICLAWSRDGKIIFKRFELEKGRPVMKVATEVVSEGAEWDFTIPGLGRANGMPVTVCDLSGGPYHGTIYVNWADQRNGEGDTDVWVASSKDGGQTWSTPTRVNDDPPGKQQFFTWMAIDQHTGYLHTVFYDRRHHDDWSTDVVLATSKDGGHSWKNEVISASPFVPSDEIFFGDYNNISAVNGVVRPIWTRYEDGKLSVWTALIAPQE